MHWLKAIGYVMRVLELAWVHHAQTRMCHRMNTSQTVQSTMSNETLQFRQKTNISVTKKALSHMSRNGGEFSVTTFV